jgi:hypothetical protein
MRMHLIVSLLALFAVASPLRAQGTLTPEQEQKRAACLGITVQEFRDWSNPTKGENRQPTKAEQAVQAAIGKKINKVPREKQIECNRQETMSETSDIMAGMEKMAGAMAQANPAAAAGMSEAPGKTAHLSADVAADLAAGRTVVRDIDWVAGTANVSTAGADAFNAAMQALTPALVAAGGKFTVDFILDPRYDQQSANYIADLRMKTLQAALPGVGLKKGKVSRDADTRLEFVKPK